MRRKLVEETGKALFWATWPLLKLRISNTERARVLLVAGNRILLLKNWYGSGEWALPGGGLKQNEVAERAVLRELMEETGIGLGIDQLRALKTAPHDHRGIRFTCHFFVVELTEPLLARPRMPEILACEWVSIDSLDRFAISPEVTAALSARNALLQ